MKKIILGMVLLSTIVFGGQKFTFKSNDLKFPLCYKKTDAPYGILTMLRGGNQNKCFFINSKAEPRYEIISQTVIPHPASNDNYLTLYNIKILSILQNGKRKTLDLPSIWTTGETSDINTGKLYNNVIKKYLK